MDPYFFQGYLRVNKRNDVDKNSKSDFQFLIRYPLHNPHIW